MRIPQYENQIRADTVVGYRAPKETMETNALQIEANRLGREANQLGRKANQFQRTTGLIEQGFDLASKIVEAGNVHELNKAEVEVDKSWQELQLKLADTPYEEHEKLFEDWKTTTRETVPKDMKWPGSKKHFDLAFEKMSNEYGFAIKKNVITLRHQQQFADAVEDIEYWKNAGNYAKVEELVEQHVHAMILSPEQGAQVKVEAHHKIAYNQILGIAKQMPIEDALDFLKEGKGFSQDITQDDKEKMAGSVKQYYNDQRALADQEKKAANEAQNIVAMDMFLNGEYEKLGTMLHTEPDIGEVHPGGIFSALDAGDIETYWKLIKAILKAPKTDENWVDPVFESNFILHYMMPEKFERGDLQLELRQGLVDGKISAKRVQQLWDDVTSKRKDDVQDAGLQAIRDEYAQLIKSTDDPVLKFKYAGLLGETIRVYKVKTSDPNMTPAKKRDEGTKLVGDEIRKPGLLGRISDFLGIEGKDEKKLKQVEQNLAAQGGDVVGYSATKANHEKLLKNDPVYKDFIKFRNVAIPFSPLKNNETGMMLYSGTGAADDWWGKKGKEWWQYDLKKKILVKPSAEAVKKYLTKPKAKGK